MKRILVLIAVLIAQTNFAQQPKLLARSTHYSDGTIDTVRFYYSGGRGGLHNDANVDVLPGQLVVRNGELPIKYDSALVWRNTGALQFLGRYVNNYDAFGKVTSAVVRNSTTNTEEVYSYNVAGYIDSISYSDSAYTWPTMAPYYFKRSFYNTINNVVADSFSYVGGALSGGYTYSYGSTGLKENVIQFSYTPAYSIADSAHFRWYPNGLLQIEEHSWYDNGLVVAGMRDTFGYAGSNPLCTYRRDDQYNQFNPVTTGWVTYFLGNYTLNAIGTGYDSIRNYNSLNSGPLPSIPSQILVATYNPDSTLARVAHYNGMNPVPFLTDYYYYKEPEPEPSGVSAQVLSSPSLKVLPVPAISGEGFSILVTGITNETPYEIVDNMGKVVVKNTISANTKMLHKGLAPGTYTVRCKGMSVKAIVY